jgi:hypothetical protein
VFPVFVCSEFYAPVSCVFSIVVVVGG